MVEAKNKTDPTQDFLRQITEATEATKRAMLLQAKVAENMNLLVPGGGVDEDAQDVTDARAIIDGVRAGTIETFPGDLVSMLVEGSNPVRVFREFRGMTGEQLASKAGISRPYLTQIETGKREPMFPVMAKIARALDVSLDLLVPAP